MTSPTHPDAPAHAHAHADSLGADAPAPAFGPGGWIARALWRAPSKESVGRTFTPDVRALVEARPDRVISDEDLSRRAGTRVETCWYMAYGSNLNSRVFRKRRGLDPLQHTPCVVRGWRLVFDLPALPLLEPTMGNVRPCEHRRSAGPDSACDCDCVLHGVAYRLTQEQFEHLHRTEISYFVEELDATTYGEMAGATIRVRVLVASPVAVNLLTDDEARLAPPSKRYVDILVHGAKEHNLAPEWIARLEAQPTAPRVPAPIKLALGLMLAAPIAALFVFDAIRAKVQGLTPEQRVHRSALFMLKEIVWSAWRLAMRASGRLGSARVAQPEIKSAGVVAAPASSSGTKTSASLVAE